MHKKKYLVTGGTGFLGASLVRRLVHMGYQVRILDNCFRSSVTRLSDVLSKVEMITGDIRDSALVNESIEGVDAVIHLAAINGTEFFYSKPDLVLDVGVRGMLNVLDGCKNNGVKELIIASSSEVYQTPTKIPSDETVPLIVPDVLNPRFSYGGSKIITELLAFNYGRKDFDKVIIFRPHNVYGPDMAWEHVLPQFILKIVDAIKKHPAGKIPFPIQGDGSQTRAFIHINDMIDGIMLLLEKGVHLNVYHIGNPEEIHIANLAKKIGSYFGRELEFIIQPLQLGSTQRRCPDITKMKALGFVPNISIDQGLPEVIEWYKKHETARGSVYV